MDPVLTYNLTGGNDDDRNEKAVGQARAKELRQRWSFVSQRQTITEDLKAWLRANAICAQPLATPVAMRSAIDLLKLSLGNPGPSKGKPGFARVSTVRLRKDSVSSGPIRKTTYKFDQRYDYQQHRQEQNVFVAQACSLITLHFLKHTPYGGFLYTLFDNHDRVFNHKVYAHVDWYPMREYNTQGFHKDTHGSTLFVGLIYRNTDRIPGPDVIANPWPIPERDSTRKPTQQRRLPGELLRPIDELLAENKSSRAMSITQTAPIPENGGMVWFIDELVHHSTPHKKAPGTKFKLAIGGSQFKPPLELAAEVDATGWDGWFPTNAPREFVRIWVTLEKPVEKQKVPKVRSYLGELQID